MAVEENSIRCDLFPPQKAKVYTVFEIDTGRFSKLPFLDMKLDDWKRLKNVCVVSFHFCKVEIELIFTLRPLQAVFQNWD